MLWTKCIRASRGICSSTNDAAALFGAMHQMSAIPHVFRSAKQFWCDVGCRPDQRKAQRYTSDKFTSWKVVKMRDVSPLENYETENRWRAAANFASFVTSKYVVSTSILAMELSTTTLRNDLKLFRIDKFHTSYCPRFTM